MELQKVYITQSKDIQVNVIGNEIILYPDNNSSKNKAAFLNPVATDIWNALSSKKTIDEVISIIYNLYDVSYEKVYADVSKIITHLREIGFIEEILE